MPLEYGSMVGMNNMGGMGDIKRMSAMGSTQVRDTDAVEIMPMHATLDHNPPNAGGLGKPGGAGAGSTRKVARLGVVGMRVRSFFVCRPICEIRCCPRRALCPHLILTLRLL